MYGPKGIGALFVQRSRPKSPILPLLFGGGQEKGLRPGTAPVALQVGMGAACDLAADLIKAPSPEGLLRDALWNGLEKEIPDLVLNGSWEDRLPQNLNLAFRGVNSEALMVAVPELGLSSGSACTSSTIEPSYVLQAMGVERELIDGSIRFGLGRGNSMADVDFAVGLLAEKVGELRRFWAG